MAIDGTVDFREQDGFVTLWKSFISFQSISGWKGFSIIFRTDIRYHFSNNIGMILLVNNTTTWFIDFITLHRMDSNNMIHFFPQCWWDYCVLSRRFFLLRFRIGHICVLYSQFNYVYSTFSCTMRKLLLLLVVYLLTTLMLTDYLRLFFFFLFYYYFAHFIWGYKRFNYRPLWWVERGHCIAMYGQHRLQLIEWTIL